MKIIKAGDVTRMQAIRRFSCEHCGCIFEADRTEYRTEHDFRNDALYVHPCPTCGRDVMAHREDRGTEL